MERHCKLRKLRDKMILITEIGITLRLKDIILF
jgi:hypothetical protein